jgi:hypothetical protein
MPSPDTVLAGLTAIANDWRWLAITWHVLLGALLMALLAGWRPSVPLLGRVLTVPLLSLSLTAWLSGNPLNGTVFAILAGVLVKMAGRFPSTAVRLASLARVASGLAFVVFGATYPHFVQAESWLTYVYASPFGILPCPTLSILIGSTLMFSNLGSRTWSTTLALVGLVYGMIGVFSLGVVLDGGLLLASGILAVAVARDAARWGSIRADDSERSRALPGDALITEPLGALTHAITIDGDPHAVWPWLIQMGAGNRAGWYSYDLLDNRGHPSATRVVPEFQSIAIGTVFPALPGVTEGFTVLAFEPNKSLILGWPSPGGEPLVTWAFILEQRARSTRLIVRARGGRGYRFQGLPSWLSVPLARLVHFLMQRKQLLGIAQRVESANGVGPEEASPGELSCPMPHRTA